MKDHVPVLRSPVTLGLVTALVMACQDAISPARPPVTVRVQATTAANPHAAASIAWHATARTVIRARATDPVPANRPNQNAQVRILAYLGLAQHTAVVTAERTKDRGTHASTAAAIAGASAAVLSHFLPLDAPLFEAQMSAGSAGGPAPGKRNREFAVGEAVGRGVAALVIERAETDRFTAPFTGTIPVGPEFWRSSSVPPSPPFLPSMGDMQTFFLASGSQFRPAPPPAFGSAEFLAALAEVRHYSDTRTAEQLRIAQYWAVPSVVSLWDEMLADLIVRYSLDERRAAHAFALTFMAGFDALIACHDAKYTYWLVRPTQVDPGITLAVPLPNHPSYPSNHACLDGAVDLVMGTLFPTEAGRIDAAAVEGAVSRIYGGLHYRFDSTVGLALGKAVGQVALASDVRGHGTFVLRSAR